MILQRRKNKSNYCIVDCDDNDKVDTSNHMQPNEENNNNAQKLNVEEDAREDV